MIEWMTRPDVILVVSITAILLTIVSIAMNWRNPR